MNFNLATLYAVKGSTLMLPKWKGYFKWDYGKNELYFINGNYKLEWKDLKNMDIINRNDWYYIT